MIATVWECERTAPAVLIGRPKANYAIYIGGGLRQSPGQPGDPPEQTAPCRHSLRWGEREEIVVG